MINRMVLDVNVVAITATTSYAQPKAPSFSLSLSLSLRLHQSYEEFLRSLKEHQNRELTKLAESSHGHSASSATISE